MGWGWVKYDYVTSFRFMKFISEFKNIYSLPFLKVRLHTILSYDKILGYELKPGKDNYRYYEYYQNLTEKGSHLLATPFQA